MESPLIVLGLGNPGTRYRRNRHNLGFRVADEIARRTGVRFPREANLEGLAWFVEAEFGGRAIVLAKPRTFMNRSGRAGAAVLSRYAVGPSNLLVVHDDADLELGRVRIRSGGRPGGHNGIRSLIAVLGSADFPRLKLGVRGAGRASSELANYVLSDFEEGEREAADAMVVAGADAAQAILADGLDAAMNRFNRASPSRTPPRPP